MTEGSSEKKFAGGVPRLHAGHVVQIAEGVKAVIAGEPAEFCRQIGDVSGCLGARLVVSSQTGLAHSCVPKRFGCEPANYAK